MPSSKPLGRLDDPILTDGDRGFRGINSYLEPTSLEPGLVEVSENMRLNGDLAEVRKGLQFMGAFVNFTYSATDQIFAAGLFSDPATGIEFLAIATKDKLILWNDSNHEGIDIAYPVGEQVAESDKPTILQSLERLIIFRGVNKKPLEWDGDYSTPTAFVVKENLSPTAGRIECPQAEFGVYLANRLIVPQKSDSNYTVIASDVLDTDNFYAAESQFRINRGTADRGVMAFMPYQENQLLVFFRNSIHMITNLADTTASVVTEVTRQMGCVARKSVAASGPQMYFLSDAGVFTIQQGIDSGKGLGIPISKVSAEALPLTRTIQDQFDDVNYGVVDQAVGIVFDNKYYLACPTGVCSIAGNNTRKDCELAGGSWTASEGNNRLFVFDIIQNAWTSVDSFPDGFFIEDFVTVLHKVDIPYSGTLRSEEEDLLVTENNEFFSFNYGEAPNTRRLLAVNKKGWHLIEESESDITGTVGNDVTTSTPINAKLRTRSYGLGNLDIKKWKRGQLGCHVENGDQFTITMNTIDPDRSNVVHTENYTGGTEDKLIRFGSGRVRGYACNVEVEVTEGRPSFRHVAVEANEGGANARRSYE